jgi:hypothetical protein
MAKEELSVQEQKDAMYAEIMERVENETRIREAKRSGKGFFYGGQLSDLRLASGRQRFKRDDKGNYTTEPVLDANEQPTFWDSTYYCTLNQLGGKRDFQISVDLGKDLNDGHWYDFSGDLGDGSKKEKVKVIVEI